jgi:E3 ubiquitin-protein ligase DMA1/2
MDAAIDLTEPDEEEDDLHDIEMMNAVPDSTDLSRRHRVSFEGGDLDAADAARSTSLSPDFVGHGHEHMNGQGDGAGQAYNMPRAGTSGAAVGDTSEGEGSGGSAEGIAMDEIIGSGSGGEGGDLTVGGKRKR